jgi:hypothetical protein
MLISSHDLQVCQPAIQRVRLNGWRFIVNAIFVERNYFTQPIPMQSSLLIALAFAAVQLFGNTIQVAMASRLRNIVLHGNTPQLHLFDTLLAMLVAFCYYEKRRKRNVFKLF